MQGIKAMLSRRALVLLAVTTVGVLCSAGVANAAAFTVNDSTDAALATPSDTSCVSTNGGSCTLRAAVQAADNSGGANTITLPANTYKLTIASTASNDPSNGDLDVNNNDNSTAITITGAGSGSTIIDANQIDRAFAVQINGGLTLSGLTVENGNPAASSSGSQTGGAIYSDGALSLTSDVTLRGNSAFNGEDGGAIYSDSDTNSSLSVTDTTFDGNGALFGAGIYDDSPNSMTIKTSHFNGGYTNDNEGGAIYGDNGGMTVDASTFSRNSADAGGAIYWNGNSDVTVTNSSFTDNAARSGGAIDDDASSSMTLTGDRFAVNSGSSNGGALYLDATNTTQYTLNQDEFDGNTSVGDGGAVYWEYGQLSSTGSSFIDNNATEDGGALALENCCNHPQLTLVNATISGNSSDFGGGIYVGNITPATLTNDTIAYNSAASGNGGGIGSASNFVLTNGSQTGTGVSNTIVAKNSGGDCDSGTFAASFDQGNNLDSDSSCFGATGGAGDKPGVDPLLGHPTDNGGPEAGAPGDTEAIETDAEHANSPTVDAGTNTGCPATDARGVTRPQGSSCDMGAFELAAAGLSLAKSAPASAGTGEAFNYTVTVSNGGPGFSTGSTVNDQLPAGETLWGVTPSQGSCTSSGSPAKVTCALGNVASGSNATVTMVVSEANAGSVTNTATATNDQGSTASGSATTQVRAPVAPAGATAPTATTGPATGVHNTTATLTGTVNPGGQPTGYFFQYGTSSSYGQITPVAHTGTSTQSVSGAISHLTAGKVYHYRLVAINDSGSSFGLDRTFRTTGTNYLGSLVLDSTKLTVKNGHVFVPFTCKSTKTCSGLFSITTRLRLANSHALATVVCTVSSKAKYTIGAHKRKLVRAPVHQSCLSALASHHGKLSVKVSTRPRTAQKGLIRLAKLFLK